MAGISLFVYGTLLNDELLERLTGHVFARRLATLEGFERVQPPDGYPYITRRAGARVDGSLLDGVDAVSLQKLDAYEGDGYRRAAVEVTVEGVRVDCESYVGKR